MKAPLISATLFVVALCAVPAFVRAQQNRIAAAGTIQGSVTRSDKGDPIAGAKVTLAGGTAGAQAMRNLLAFAASQGLMIPTPPPGTSDEQIMQAIMDTATTRGLPVSRADIQTAMDQIGGATFPSTVTDSAGHFTFNNVSPERYTVRIERNGYFAASNNGPSLMALSSISVEAGQTAAVTVALSPTAVISGRVRDAAGRPMSNVVVQAYRVFYVGGIPLLNPVISKQTDDMGEYRLIWVVPGEYYVGVTPRPPSATTIVARNPQDVETFFPAAPDPSTAIPITLRAGEEASSIDIGVRKIRPFHVSGRVNSSVPPPPVSGDAKGVFAIINQQQNNTATIYIISRNPTSAERDELNSSATVVLNASSGTFDIPNILPGAYDLYARVNDQSGPAFGHVAFDVASQDVSGLTVNIRSSVDVSGSVNAPPGTTPADSWRVLVEPSGNLAKLGFGWRAGPIGARSSPIGKDGAFRIQGIPPGHYRLSISGLPPGLFLDTVRRNGTNVTDIGFDVGVDAVSALQMSVRSGAGSVGGSAKPGTIVALIPNAHRDNHMLYYGATANAAGVFALLGVVPGDYKLFAWESTPPGAYLNADFLRKYEDLGTPVTVASGSTLRLGPVVTK